MSRAFLPNIVPLLGGGQRFRDSFFSSVTDGIVVGASADNLRIGSGGVCLVLAVVAVVVNIICTAVFLILYACRWCDWQRGC